MIVPTNLRKPLLILHVMTSIGLLGAVGSFLVLAVTGMVSADATTVEAAYVGMAVLTWRIIVPLAFTALAVGIIQSLPTPWGLFRHYWVSAKLALTVLAVAVLMAQTKTIDRLAAATTDGTLGTRGMEQAAMVVHAAGGLLVLAFAIVLSVYKPRGMTPFAKGAARPA